MVLGGELSGTDGLTTYDAACLALAYMDERWSASEMVFNDDATAALHESLGIPLQQVSDSATDDLAEMRAGIGGGANSAPPPAAATTNSTKAEVDELRSMIGG